MSRVLTLLLPSLLCAISIAQVANSGEALLDISVERARIQSDRDAGEFLFNQRETTCYARFAVTDCLREVRVQRRHLLDDLRRQTVLLNDMERRKKTLSKVDRIELKSSSHEAGQVN